MQITKTSTETMAGAGEWSPGAVYIAVYIDTIATPSAVVQPWFNSERIRADLSEPEPR
jgi:hypothetical protein